MPIFRAENCRKSQKIVKNRRKLLKIAENCQKSPKIVKKSLKIFDHNIDPWFSVRPHYVRKLKAIDTSDRDRALKELVSCNSYNTSSP
jgi:hypothetical protein